MWKSFDFKKDVLPHLIVVLVSFLVVGFYFKPQVFGKKYLSQGDIIQHRGATKEHKKFKEETGETSFWTGSMFSGMPTFGIDYQSEGSIGMGVLKTAQKVMAWPFVTIWLGIIGFYLMLLVLKVPIPLAGIGGLLFGFSSFVIASVEAGHNTKVATMMAFPYVMAGVFQVFFRNKLWSGAALTAIGMSMMVAAAHFQIVYYGAFIVVAFGISYLVVQFNEKNWKNFGVGLVILMVAAGLGIFSNYNNLATTQEYTQASTRGKGELKDPSTNKKKDEGLDMDYIFAWSMGIGETFTYLIPNYMGGGSNEQLEPKSEVFTALRKNGVSPQQFPQVPYYWGDQPFTGGPNYIGAVAIFLFVLGLITLEGKWKWWLLAIVVWATLLSWGKNFEGFNSFLVNTLPMYNKFRTVTMSFFMVLFVVPLGAILALSHLFEKGQENSDEYLKKLYIALGLTGGICLLFALIPSLAGDFVSERDAQLPEWLKSALSEERSSRLKSDAFRSFALIAVCGAMIWVYLKKQVNFVVAVAVIGVVAFADVWVIDRRFLNEENFTNQSNDEAVPLQASDRRILQDPTHYRVLNLQNPFNEAYTSFYHKSIGGYSAAKLQCYKELIDRGLSTEIQKLVDVLRSGKFTPDTLTSFPILNMLNTKYFKYGPEENAVIMNPKAYGNAWFVSKVEEVEDAETEITRLETLNPLETVVIRKGRKMPSSLSYNKTANASISLSSYKPNALVYQTNNAENGFAVFSEVYYENGWQVSIDGNPVEMVRVNYVLRGLEIPAGQHKIEFIFDPETHKSSRTISYVASLLVLGLIGFGLFSEIKAEKKES